MNSTPRDRVLALHPNAFVQGGAGAWTVYAEPAPLGTPQKILGRGSNAARAWKRAAERLVNPSPKKKGMPPKAVSYRAF